MTKKRQKRYSQTQTIRKRLAAYSATAGAVMALGGSTTLIMSDVSEAVVDYTSVNQILTSNTFTGTFGSLPFTIRHVRNGTTSGSSYASIVIASGAVSSTGGRAKTFPSSSPIVTIVGASNAQICTHTFTLSNSNTFPQVKGRFIGVRFTLSGPPPTTHYGWIRINVAANCGSVTILDYAYENQADTPIHAGVPAPVGGIVHDISDTGDASQE